MKKIFLTLLLAVVAVAAAEAQKKPLFAEELKMPAGFNPKTVVLPPSPLSTQVLFVGGADMVQHNATYGYPAGETNAKEWHDFIGFTPDTTGKSLGWISVNHETVYRDDRLGDGGGMTVFRVKRDAMTDSLVVVDQSLADGRKGKFFNVDFVNHVGETAMNCAGISSRVDGRIWTAEEWWRTNNASINDAQNLSAGGSLPNKAVNAVSAKNQGIRDTSDFTIKNSGIAGFDGTVLKKYQNINWMVEIDPREAKAVRKQYNWGRQAFEGGTIALDNKTVYLGEDETPGFFSKFVADTPGDFTKGKMYVYKHDTITKWVEIPVTVDNMVNFRTRSLEAKGTMYVRCEWVAVDPVSGKIYWTETGNDGAGPALKSGLDKGGVYDPYHINRATALGLASPGDANYKDYYGRVWVYDPATMENYVILEGGPDLATSPAEADYPAIHLSNPDGLNVMTIDSQSFLVICEDLNGRTFGRVPAGVNNNTCEVYLLDLSIEKPTREDLVRLTAVPSGSEVTGAMPTSDNKSLLLNVQHPSITNPFPYNHSLTFAINGFDRLKVTDLKEPELNKTGGFQVYPNPTTRMVYLNQTTDVAIFNVDGKRMRTLRNTSEVNVSDLKPGVYFLQNATGDVQKLIIQ